MATTPRRPPMKNITPPRGAVGKTEEKRQEGYTPKFKSDKPQTRTAQGGRGNERVTGDDTARAAEQATTTRWDKMPNALEYLRRFVDSKDFPLDKEMSRTISMLLMECLRRYVEKMEELARNEKKTLTPETAMRLMDLAYRFKESVGDLVKSPAEKVFDILRFTVVPEVFGDAGVTNMALENIGRLNLVDDISVSVAKENKQEFYQWLTENEFEDLLTQTVNAQTLAAFVRKQMKEKDGKMPPAHLCTIKPVTRAQITRAS